MIELTLNINLKNFGLTMNFKDLKIAKTFKLTKKLGSGAFGEIFHGINLKNNMEVALKLEVKFNNDISL